MVYSDSLVLWCGDIIPCSECWWRRPITIRVSGMETERGDDPCRLGFQGMETERGDDLREAKRLRPSPATDAISFKSEEVPSAEMNVDVDRLDCDPGYSDESDDDYLIPISPDMLKHNYLLDRYKRMKLSVYYVDMAYKGGPVTDKEYLFLFCELKGDPIKYQQVLSDMELVMQWKRSPLESINCLYDSDDLSVQRSVVMAKRVIVENKLNIGLSEILGCFWDLHTEWRLQKEFFGYKMYEEFLLDFWEENKREPTRAEIKEKFCQGYFPPEEDDTSLKFFSLAACIKPASGKVCYRN